MPRGPIVHRKRDFLSPQKVIEELDIKEGDLVIDFGSGSGFWAIPIAQKVGHSGRVYVTDPKIENLTIIKRKADQFGLKNIEYIQAPYNSKSLPVKVKADFILIANILSEIDDDEKLIKSTKNNAHVETKLIVIDWDQKTPLSVNKSGHSEIEQIMLWAQKAGFVFKKLLDAGAHHFGLYFEYNNK